jgi:hypothetical protein
MKVEPKTEEAQNPRTEFALEVFSRVDERDREEDDITASYVFFSEISSCISAAQSGRGPLRDRFFEIAVIAIAAIEKTDRNA